MCRPDRKTAMIQRNRLGSCINKVLRCLSNKTQAAAPVSREALWRCLEFLCRRGCSGVWMDAALVRSAHNPLQHCILTSCRVATRQARRKGQHAFISGSVETRHSSFSNHTGRRRRPTGFCSQSADILSDSGRWALQCRGFPLTC